MQKGFWVALVGIIVVLFGVFLLAGGKADESDNPFAFSDPLVINENDNVKGTGTSVTFIEYGDFECPGCGAFAPILAAVEEEFQDEVTFVYRHNPLTTIHPNALAAHRAAEAARAQGQFWEMHDLLFARQGEWVAQVGVSTEQAIDIFEGYAVELGLDIDQFNADRSSDETSDRINAQIDSGQALGVTGTPTLLINGQQIDTPRSVEELREVLQAAIDEANAADQTGSLPAEQPSGV